MRLIMATRTDRCRLRLGWETIAARRKREGDCHEVFHDWWLEDRPALNLFESLEPHDTVEIEGLGGARPEALNVGLDAWDLMPVSETQVVEWFRNHDVDSPVNGTSKADDSVPSLDMPSF